MNSNSLFSPFDYKHLYLKNRIVMPPMTRSRAGNEGIPGAMNAQYYAQQATAGLIISEATNISPQALGFAFTPGIFNDAQVAGWRLVTDAVHAAGGLIFCQLWHVGRISHPSMQPGGALPVAPSAVTPEAQVFTAEGFQPCVMPRALELDEIPGVIEQYRTATNSAKAAGFDGVEILAGGGYLIEQFLKDKTNKRTDDYGSSIPNRVRFLTEVVEGVINAWSADRVGVRIGPFGTVGDIDDSDPEALFSYVVEQFNQLNIAYMHVMENAVPGGPRDKKYDVVNHKLRRQFNGMYIANSGYDLELAVQTLQENLADLIAFGRPFISNPDLVERLKTGAPLTGPDFTTFYAGGGATGYTDYPALSKTTE